MPTIPMLERYAAALAMQLNVQLLPMSEAS